MGPGSQRGDESEGQASTSGNGSPRRSSTLGSQWGRGVSEAAAPQPTILTTGTGSGKTEAFLYPLLDYARQHQKTHGIKAIVLYPMNALATDQAKRFAEACWEIKKQTGEHLTVGLLIGEGAGKKDQRNSSMEQEKVIENRTSILNNPPDILLTNFKMLDYALMRDGLNKLWKHNLSNPDLLKYLVLDELHTYDGAQGTDVANLLRRLKLKLESKLAPDAQVRLTPVGTSATVGDESEGRTELAEYASKLFGETIDESAIIGETRLDIDTLFGDSPPAQSFTWPSVSLNEYDIQPNEKYADYQARQLVLWGLDAKGLYAAYASPTDKYTTVGEGLRKHPIGALLVRLLHELQNRPTHLGPVEANVLQQRLEEFCPGFSAAPKEGLENSSFAFTTKLRSLLSLFPLAKKGGNPPLLYLRQQHWARELTGVHLEISEDAQWVWHQDAAATDEAKPHAAPAWNCRDCGAGGWLIRWVSDRTVIEIDRKGVLQDYFDRHTRSWLMFQTPAAGFQKPAGIERLNVEHLQVNVATLELTTPLAGAGAAADQLNVTLTQQLNTSEKKITHTCPCCGSEGGISLVGGRKTTVSSVLASQILADPYDPIDLPERKLLAFSNSVQDAAHIAGFVESRSYRFTMRNATVQVLGRRTKSLAQLPEMFESAWMKEFDDNELQYVARFFPADKIGRVDFRSYLQKGVRQGDSKFSVRFLDELNHRIHWELLSEFGLASDRGRTLLRTGAAGIQFEEKRIRDAMPGILNAAQEHLGQPIQPAVLRRFVFGMLHYMRQQGAIDHPFLSAYRHVDWSTFMLNWSRKSGGNSKHYLNPVYGGIRYAPRLFTSTPAKRKDHIESLLPTRGNTLIRYFIKCLNQPSATSPQLRFDDASISRFLIASVEVLSQDPRTAGAKASILNKVVGKPGTSFAIEPSALLVASEAHVVQCNSCGYHTSSTEAGLSQLEGVVCFRKTCNGTLEVKAGDSPTYYTDLYANPRTARIFAADHTGMLARDTREALEQDFQKRPQPDSTNVLVATSTLEMGINIGDLNTVVNTNIPPTTSNYLQRIGRAGRKSGSAQIFNVASASIPHDLYYFTEPKEMMAGQVDTPGCFLEAKDILQRHFMAYVLDDYTAIEGNEIPAKLRNIQLGQKKFDSEWFPHKVREHMRKEGERLLQQMRELYLRDQRDNEALLSAFSAVAKTLREEQLERNWIRAFTTAVEEWRSVSAQLTAIQKEIKSKDLAETDDRRISLVLAKRNLTGSRNRLRKRQVLEHLTNFGLLPNYAFPQTGVTLDAQVTLPLPQIVQGSMFENDENRERFQNQKKAKSKRKYESKDFELVRPADSALREMMPGQTFYTQGYKLPINSVVINDYDEQSCEMRYCSQCDHLAEVQEGVPLGDTCPKCKHVGFGSPQNQHRFFRPTGVRAHTQAGKARIRDDKDDRESSRPMSANHVTLPSKKGARLLKEIPFGVELNHDVHIRQVNLGPQTVIGAIDYQNVKAPAVGYITCKFCGHATSEANKYDFDTAKSIKKPASDFHLPFCRKANVQYENEEDETFAHLYFYHELNTEALRILLPASTVDSIEKVALFKSALILGIRKHFRGSPNHLELLDYTEYSKDGKPQRFIILYDKVPGGTGYLSQLYEEETFNEVLRKAYAQIRDCACKQETPDRDGCYRCVLSYRFRKPELLKRSKAEEFLAPIVASLEEWDHLPEGFGEQNIGEAITRTEESELEEMFTGLFFKLSLKQNSHWKAETITSEGEKHYRLTYQPEHAKSLVYQLTPQPKESEGVLGSGKTRPDFIIKLDLENSKGPLPEETFSIAIFTDGYNFHASAMHPNFEKDIEKRALLVSEGKYLPWTLSYHDVHEVYESLSKGDEGDKEDFLAPFVRRAEQDYWLGQAHPASKGHVSDWLTAPNNFLRLLKLMEAGAPKIAAQKGVSRLLMLAQPKVPSRPQGTMLTEEATDQGLQLGWRSLETTTPSQTSTWPALTLPLPSDRQIALRAATRCTTLDPFFCLFAKRSSLEGYERKAWRESWQLLNLMFVASLGQPLEVTIQDETSVAVTNWEFAEDIDTALEQFKTSSEKADTSYNEAAQRERFAEMAGMLEVSVADAVLEKFVALKWREGHDFEWGFSYTEGGVVAAEAELGSLKHKFFIEPFTEDARQVLAKAGLKEITFENLNTL